MDKIYNLLPNHYVLAYSSPIQKQNKSEERRRRKIEAETKEKCIVSPTSNSFIRVEPAPPLRVFIRYTLSQNKRQERRKQKPLNEN